MCGIAGVLGFGEATDPGVLRAMGERMRLRGPDDEGVWVDRAAGIGLVHRRLAIVDLSPTGRQPMTSRCGRWTIVFNGEIYNHEALRSAVGGPGVEWRGRSDTEVLLNCFASWGVRRTLESAVGMFAIALWDAIDGTLHLIRDRLGEKPLYYGWQSGVLLFGSELKALAAHPAFEGEIDRDAVDAMLRLSAVPAPGSIYRGVRKLPPGTVLSLPWRRGAAACGAATPSHYWRLQDAIERGRRDPFTGSDDEAVDALERLVLDAVQLQRVADVPLGAFLSGGIDSSTVVALMQSVSDRPVRTFTVGFDEQGYDEATHGAAVARHLGTDHTELRVPASDALGVIQDLPEMFDEPFADVSQIPTHLVARLARRSVTVALSGDGGDELFCGYARYLHAASLARVVDVAPLRLRAALGNAVRSVPERAWDRFAATVSPVVPRSVGGGRFGARLHRAAWLLGAPSSGDLHARAVSRWPGLASVVIGASKPGSGDVAPDALSCAADPIEHAMMFADTVGYLSDDVLVKVDRATMAVSLESRTPLLDHRIVEFAWRLPLALKLRHGQGKWILRRVLDRYVPKGLVERPKMGFAVPIGAWLRGPLGDWAGALLEPGRLRAEGYLDPEIVSRLWREHAAGRIDAAEPLWNLLMFQSWLERR